MTGSGWTVVIPVKSATIGKSRLDVPGVDRIALARAIAADTIAAAAACDTVSRVIVVTDDRELAALGEGVEVFPDPGSGLSDAITAGLTTAGAGDRAILLGDLPALRPADLAAALTDAKRHDRAAVPDAEGTGTTLVTARAGVDLAPLFGEGSFARHLASGFSALAVPAGSTLRQDVDTADQLDLAAALGLGPRTAAVLS